MNDARDQVLARLRGAVSDVKRTRGEDYAAIPRAYRQAGSLGREECIDLVADRLAHYDAGVYRCDATAIQATVAQALRARGKTRVVVPADLPGEWLPDGFEFVPDTGASHVGLDQMEGVLTGATVAIASTGTIVLRHGAAEGRRALTLIPDYHLCVVRVDQIVETVPEAFRRIAALKPRLLTTISGPSATADIEMTRIKGVHGPRTLDVVLVT